MKNKKLLNYRIHFLRKIIVYLINKLDKLLQKKGSFSYKHMPNEKHLPVKKIAENCYGIFWDEYDIGRFINKDFKMCDTCLFDPYIEACLINQWFYTAIANLEVKYMRENYKKIEFGFGGIESVVKELIRYKENGELVFGEFNGINLYSDFDDTNSIYKKITGKTKTEFDAEMKADNDQEKEEERKHKEAIPELTDIIFVNKGSMAYVRLPLKLGTNFN